MTKIKEHKNVFFSSMLQAVNINQEAYTEFRCSSVLLYFANSVAIVYRPIKSSDVVLVVH